MSKRIGILTGGGDCPELSMRGTLNAVSASDEGGDVFLFTDASSKDAALAGSVLSLALRKKVRLNFAVFGSCSPFIRRTPSWQII